MASVALEGVTKAFSGGVTAVNDLDLHVQDREFLVLLGPSGCGKSTTLRLIAGLEESTSGEIRIGDRVVNDVAPKNRNIAMVFQNYALYPHMSVYKNMAFGLQLRYGSGWFSRLRNRLTKPAEAAQLAAKRRGIRTQVQETARALGIEHLLDRMPRQLSGGESQRVALGRAIVRHPAVFLFDEPLSNLDAQLRLETRRELKQLHQRLQTTMVYVTHDQTEALTLGERIAVLNRGELQQLGTPQEIYNRPDSLFVAGFIGSPPMNLVHGHLRQSEQGAEFYGNGLQTCVSNRVGGLLAGGDNREIVLGVRPEDCQRATGEDTTAARGSVSVVEMVGDASYVHIRISNPEATEKSPKPYVYKTAPEANVRPGDAVRLAVDPGRLHFFDPQSGKRLNGS